MPPAPDAPAPVPATLLSPRLLFVAGSLLVLLALTLSPRARAMLGIFDHGRWFLDSYAVLAGSDAVRAGIDPIARNPYDVFQRPHSYSDWWYGLGKLGLTREDNFLVGGAWVLMFLGAVFLTVRPRSRGEALWLILLTGSPPVMLGLIRANNDLVVFAVLAVAVLALRQHTVARIVLAVAAVMLATGLKFYPVAAGAVFLLLPGRRRMLTTVTLAAGVLALVLWSVRAQLVRGTFHLEPELFTLGARVWLMDLGLAAPAAVPVSFLLLAAGAVLAAGRGWTRGLAREDADPGLRQAMTIAAALLVFCFLGTINFGYRWIFALWLAPWLWRERTGSRAARLAVWLLPFVLWHDALLCLATNLWLPDFKPAQYDRIFVQWRLCTEPFTWALMILFGGWLADLLFARGRAQRSGAGESRRTGP